MLNYTQKFLHANGRVKQETASAQLGCHGSGRAQMFQQNVSAQNCPSLCWAFFFCRPVQTGTNQNKAATCLLFPPKPQS